MIWADRATTVVLILLAVVIFFCVSLLISRFNWGLHVQKWFDRNAAGKRPRRKERQAGKSGFFTAVFFALVAILVLGVVVNLWPYIQEQITMKQCLTAYERRAHAAAAPDDYFGRQLREAAADEGKKCAELATKKEAEAAKSKPSK